MGFGPRSSRRASSNPKPPAVSSNVSSARRALSRTNQLPLATGCKLLEGGSDTWVAFMEELRTLHLGTPKKPGARSVFAELHATYERVLTEVETEAG